MHGPISFERPAARGAGTASAGQYLHIFSKAHRGERAGSSCDTYFFVGPDKKPSPRWMLLGQDVHAVKKLPAYCTGTLPAEDDGYVGHVKHTLSMKGKIPVAVSSYYFPLGKEYNWGRHNDLVGGKSHLLEIYALNSAKALLGATHASTCRDEDNKVSESRKYQLNRVGNPIGKPLPIGEWIANLAKRINEAVNLFGGQIIGG